MRRKVRPSWLLVPVPSFPRTGVCIPKFPAISSDPYGQAVVIHHDFGYKDQALYTVYAHMSKIIAVVGQHVETGDVLGLVGDTGATTGPHLHFEVRLGDEDVLQNL